MLQSIDIKLNNCQALILVPTRELVDHIESVVMKLGDFMGVKCISCTGGTNVQDTMSKLDDGVHVVVGTPGRVYDMINRGSLRIKDLKMFVLDEADELLSRVFKDQMCDIFRSLPQTTQVILLSATMPEDLINVTTKLMRNPIQILVKKHDLTLEGIKQFYIEVEKEEWKLDTLVDIYETVAVAQVCVCVCGCVLLLMFEGVCIMCLYYVFVLTFFYVFVIIHSSCSLSILLFTHTFKHTICLLTSHKQTQHAHSFVVGHLLQHPPQGGLVVRQTQRKELPRLVPPRRNVAKRS